MNQVSIVQKAVTRSLVQLEQLEIILELDQLLNVLTVQLVSSALTKVQQRLILLMYATLDTTAMVATLMLLQRLNDVQARTTAKEDRNSVIHVQPDTNAAPMAKASSLVRTDTNANLKTVNGQRYNVHVVTSVLMDKSLHAPVVNTNPSLVRLSALIVTALSVT